MRVKLNIRVIILHGSEKCLVWSSCGVHVTLNILLVTMRVIIIQYFDVEDNFELEYNLKVNLSYIR